MNRFSALAASVCSLVLFAGCIDAPGREVGHNVVDTSGLSKEQAELLEALKEGTERNDATFRSIVWTPANTLYRLDLAVPSSAAEGAPLEEHALAFVSAHLPLWHLRTEDQLQLRSVVSGGDCSFVVLQLVRDGTAVFNATLTVTLTELGVIRSVVGRMDGRREAEVEEVSLSAAEARHVASRELDWPEEGTEEPQPVIYDPLFATGSDGAPRQAWIFHAYDQRGAPNAVYPVVIDSDGPPAFSGPTFPSSILNDEPFACESADHTAFAGLFVLDPLTETPAMADFRHLGGLRVSGSSDEERAMRFLSLPQVQRFWGSAAPSKHLQHPRTKSLPDGTRLLTFEQHYAGVPVDGAYLSVVFDAGDRIRTVFARFVYGPHTGVIPNVNEVDAIAHVTAAARDEVCDGDASCEQVFEDRLLQRPPSATLVIATGRIHEDPVFHRAHKLAWKVRVPGRIVYWDATNNAELRSIPMHVELVSDVHKSYSPPVTSSPTCGHAPYDCRLADGVDPVSLGYRLESDNGAMYGPLHPRTHPVELWLLGTEHFYLSQLRYSPLASARAAPDGSKLHVLIDSYDTDNAASLVDATPHVLLLGADVTVDDVVAHEFAHAVTEDVVSLNHLLEPGAIDEFYADLTASGAFPASDGGWTIGEDLDGGFLRNMKEPWLSKGPNAWHTSLKHTACDSYNQFCRHAWMGIPSRAAALIADGRPDGSDAFGRMGMINLFFEALQQLEPADRFLNLRLKTVQVCEQHHAARQVLGGLGSVPTKQHCAWVREAFDLVGVNEVVRTGYDRYPSGYYAPQETFRLFEGRRTFNGCTIVDHVLRAEIAWWDSGEMIAAHELASDSTSTIPPHTIIYPPGAPAHDVEVRVAMTSRGPPADSTLREITYVVDAKWLTGTHFVYVDEVMDKGTNTSASQCVAPPNTVEEELWSPLRTFKPGFAPFDATATTLWGFGARVSVPINTNVQGPCTVLAVQGVDVHKGDKTVPPARSVVDHGHHGFTVTGAIGGTALDANLSAWYNGDSAIFARVAYTVARPEHWSPGSCAVGASAIWSRR